MRIRSPFLFSVSILALLIGSLIGAQKTSADIEDYVNLNNGPAKITSSSTGSFMISSMMHGPVECKVDGADFTPCASNPFTTDSLGQGEHTFTVHAVGATNPEATASYSWVISRPPELVGSASISGPAGVPIAISDLQIDDSGNENLTVRLNVADGSLAMSDTTGLIFNGSHTGTNLEFSGTRTSLNSALATLHYTPAQVGTANVSAYVLGQNGDDFDTINGHVFKVIRSDTGLTWLQAKEAAEASSYGGFNGYLASITSSEENDFISERVATSSAWTGGNDIATEGDWQWSGGSESGNSFWDGDLNGSAVGGAYTHWSGGMPDNYQEEDCLEVYQSDPSINWNDQNCDAQRYDYVVEYGDGETIPYASSKQISITSSNDTDGDGTSNVEESAAPNSGDANHDGTPDYQQANVISYLNPVSGNYAVFETDCDSVAGFEVGSESSEGADNDYSYPFGLVGFHISCGEEGATARIRQYYYGVEGSDKYSVRKWRGGNDYQQIPAQDLGLPTDDNVIFFVQYNITDGGEFDDDGQVNGVVVDPSGVALVDPSSVELSTTSPTNQLAGTGQSPLLLIINSMLLLMISFLSLRIIKSRAQ